MFKISDFDKDTAAVYRVISNASATGTLISEKEIQDDTSHRIDTEPILKKLLEESYIRKIFLGFKTLYFLNDSEFIATIIENVKSQYSDSSNLKASLNDLQRDYKDSLSFVTKTKEEIERFEKQFKGYLVKETSDFLKNPDEKKALSLTHPFLKGTHNHIIIDEFILKIKNTRILKIVTNYNIYYFDEAIIFENLETLKENVKRVSEGIDNFSSSELDSIYKEILEAHNLSNFLRPESLITLDPEEKEIIPQEDRERKEINETLSKILSNLEIEEDDYEKLSSEGKFFIETLYKISSPTFFKKVASTIYSCERHLKEDSSEDPFLILIDLFYLFRITSDPEKRDLLFDLVKRMINNYAVKDYLILKLYKEMESSLLGKIEQEISEENKKVSQKDTEKNIENTVEKEDQRDGTKIPPIDELPIDDTRDPIPDETHQGIDLVQNDLGASPKEENDKPSS